MSDVENIKTNSQFLRGTIEKSLADSLTGAVAEDDTQLLKFHGTYQQDDRDTRVERSKRKLEPDYSFMIRARVPAGVCTPAQWLAMDELACKYANQSIRLTTRQAFQLHGIIKTDLKPTIAGINQSLLDTLAACGDVNRNVMCSPNPELSAAHAQACALASEISAHLTPQTNAYHEIWLDGEKVNPAAEQESIYGATYLPRKFKIGIAVPPDNDVDVYSQDLGFIAIVEDGQVVGYNVTVGGGMGVTHGDANTYPRVGDVLGFCLPQQVIAVAEAIVTIQRDFGDRGERKHARFKYTVADRGLAWLAQELEQRTGYALQAPREFQFSSSGDRYGWQQTAAGVWLLGLFVENGRVSDDGHYRLLSALRGIAHHYAVEFRLSPNQNLILANIDEDTKAGIDVLLREHGIDAERQHSALRLNSMACVGLPTCGLAMAESERYLPELVTRLEQQLTRLGLAEQAITLRMTGCPNGCARPYLAEIGLVGKAPGRYNLHLGAGFVGHRLNQKVLDNANEEEILAFLIPQLEAFAEQREAGEHFGDFVLRQGVLQQGHGHA